MKKRIPVMKVRWFDHEESDLVDVRPNAEGEFVQVWDKPFRTPNRNLLLAYQRTPNGPENVSSGIQLDEGPFSVIDTTGPRRTLYYRDRPEYPRYEEILPSGRLLVEDFRNGLIIDKVHTTDFDRDAWKPIGKKLGNRSQSKRESEGESWFISHFQERWVGEDLVEKVLMMVVEYRGREVAAVSEFSGEHQTPD